MAHTMYHYTVLHTTYIVHTATAQQRAYYSLCTIHYVPLVKRSATNAKNTD